MNKVLIILLISFNLLANPCNFAFEQKYILKSAQSDSLIKRAFNLEKITKKLKVFNKNYQSVERELLAGNPSMLLDKYETIFKNIDTSSSIIKANKIKIDRINLRGKNIDDVGKQNLISLQKDIDKYSKVLGNNYRSYSEAHRGLKTLLKKEYCNLECRKAVREGLKKLKTKLSNREISSLFSSSPKAFSISKRKVLINSTAQSLKKLLKNRYVMRYLFLKIPGSSSKFKVFQRLFKKGYDHRFHEINKHLITKVSQSKLTAVKKVELIEKEIGKIDLDDFFVDFSRTNDGRSQLVFDEIFDHLKTSGKSSLFARVEQAKLLGKKIGKVGAKKPLNTDWLIGSLIFGGATFAYMNFTTKTEEVQESLNLESDEVIEIEFDSVEDKVIQDEFTRASQGILDLENSAAQH